MSGNGTESLAIDGSGRVWLGNGTVTTHSSEYEPGIVIDFRNHRRTS